MYFSHDWMDYLLFKPCIAPQFVLLHLSYVLTVICFCHPQSCCITMGMAEHHMHGGFLNFNQAALPAHFS